MGQPVIFETIERGMCLPTGRGQGTSSDDCYAFGVVLALLAVGTNPFKGLDDEATLRLKMERGSFGAIIGNHRLPTSLIELLRGVLTDDAQQRWTALDLEQWLNGRRLTPKSSDSARRASRHFQFCGQEYWQVRPLAMSLVKNVSEAAKIIENGSLDKWMRRAMGDNERANDMGDAIESLKASGKTVNYEDQLVSRLCIALDPSAPIRYRGLSVMPSGISTMMIEAMTTGANVQPLSEIIGSQLVSLWVEMQKEQKTDMVPMGQQFERMRILIEKTTFGNGIERVVYELNPGLPCLSPFLRSLYVTSPKTLLPALERVAISGNRPREPIDRHLAAFLVVRDRRSELLFDAMASNDMSLRKGVAMLTLYSEMQYRFGPDNLPGLAQWLAPFLEPAIHRFLGKAMREKTQIEMKEALNRGDLNALIRLVDDPKRIERNQQDFTAARILFFSIQKEILKLETRLNHREALVASTGKPMAATLCSFISIVLVILAVVRSAWQILQM
jgi:hypothetical protein